MNILPGAWAKNIPSAEVVALGLALVAGLGIALLPLTWAVLLVVGAGVVLATLVYPQLGLLLILPAVPFGSLRQIQVGVMNVGLAEALVALVLAAWLARMVARREIRWQWPPLSLPLMVFLGVLLLSSLVALSLSHSFKELLKWVEVLALYVMVANELHGRWLRLFVVVLLGSGALAALQGIYQFLFQVGPEGFILFGRFMRAYGTFDQPNPYAGYLGLTLPVALGLVVAVVLPVAGRARTNTIQGQPETGLGASREGIGARAWWLVWAGGCGALMLAALVMSWSRGAWLGFAAAVGAMTLAIVVRRGRTAVLLVLAGLVVAYVVLAGGLSRLPPALVERFADLTTYVGLSDVRGVEVTDANFAVLERMAHWQSALDMWTDHPWLGVGIGNYEVAYGQYALPQWPAALGHAHNYYLNIAAEAGVLGLAAYLLLWGAALVSAWRAAQHARGVAWGLALGILGILVHLGVHNVFDNLFVHGMYLQLGMLLGTIPCLTASRRGMPAPGAGG